VAKTPGAIPLPVEQPTPPIAIASEGDFAESIRAVLDRFDVADTGDGIVALRAARTIDGGMLTGGAISSLLKVTMEAVDRATRGAAPVGDLMDELAARRGLGA